MSLVEETGRAEAVQQLALPIDSPFTGMVKNDRNTMVFNFFALTKERVTSLPEYDDGKIRISVRGTEKGIANIWDKEVLIYVASIIQDKINRGEPVTNQVNFTAHDFFRVVGRDVGGKDYDRLEEALVRLQGTQVTTNIETGGEGEDGAFSWISTYKMMYRRNARGEKVMKSVRVEICDWLFRAISRDKKMLTYDHDYFSLPPIERRLYEIARAHCGMQKAFRIGLEKLYRKVGAEMPIRNFKDRLKKLSEKGRSLPEYGMVLIDPREKPAAAASRGRKAPPPPGRLPLKAWQVYFFRRDSLSTMAPPSAAPLVEDDVLDMGD
ncbi:MAG TPA: replication initiator protein A [Azospirillaceae bacterium]|nr:replication initiator protein A [Azospirillaceae bacterium]